MTRIPTKTLSSTSRKACYQAKGKTKKKKKTFIIFFFLFSFSFLHPLVLDLLFVFPLLFFAILSNSRNEMFTVEKKNQRSPEMKCSQSKRKIKEEKQQPDMQNTRMTVQPYEGCQVNSLLVQAGNCPLHRPVLRHVRCAAPLDR